MGRIFLTGDAHGEVNKITTLVSKIDNPTKDDILIILGDFGMIWNSESLSISKLISLGELPITIAFLDGNHENFPLIEQFENPIRWNCGWAGGLPGNIIHLYRGEIYEIGNKKIGVCGGADSYDKFRRTEGLNWWSTETITNMDIERFKINLIPYKDKIDLVLSHDAPADIIPAVKLYAGISDRGTITESQRQLNKIKQLAEFNKWYFGHWHIDKIIDDKFECMYDQMKEIK